jgi:hypothetical protein
VSEVLDMQVYSLLARMHELRDRGCRQLREAAAADAQRLVAEARHRARQRVKDAVVEKRRRVEEHCRRVRVELESRRREERFAELGARLTEGLAALPAALEARWSRPDQRRGWCHHVLDGAAGVLRPGRWTLLAAPGLTGEEQEELVRAAGAMAGEAVTLELREDLTAGLVVTHDGARYDGSVAGMTANHNAVRAALLAELGAAGKAT